MPQLKVVERSPTPAESEVTRLRLLIRAVQAERDERMQPPVDRLQETIAEAEQLGREADSLQRDFDAAMDRWIVEPSGEQPEPSSDLLACRQRHLAALTRADAARRALPAAQQAVEICGARAAQLAAQLNEAVTALAVEKLEAYLAGPFSAALSVALECEARAISVERLLWSRNAGPVAASLVAKAKAKHGVGYNVHALSDADAVVAGRLFEAARSQHPVDEQAAERFISELADDPAKEL